MTSGSLKVPAPPSDLGIVDEPASAPPSRAQLQQHVGLAISVGGAASLAIATFYGFRAHTAAADVERAYAMGAKWKDVADLDARGRHAATTAKIFGIGGGIGLATGVTLFVLGKRAERLPPISIKPTTRGAEVSYAWRF